MRDCNYDIIYTRGDFEDVAHFVVVIEIFLIFDPKYFLIEYLNKIILDQILKIFKTNNTKMGNILEITTCINDVINAGVLRDNTLRHNLSRNMLDLTNINDV